MFELEEIRNMISSDKNGQSETAQGDRVRPAFALCTLAGGNTIIDDLTKSSKLAIDKFLGKTQFIKIQALPASRRAARAYPSPCQF